MTKEEITASIHAHVQDFKSWAKESFSSKQIAEETYDDTGYPNWDTVALTFENAFKQLDFANLGEEALTSIGFLLARQWDVGIIFPYFRDEISQVGMTQEQLIIIGEFALTSQEWSLRQQCAAAIWKAKDHTKEATRIALQFYQDSDVDIQRHAYNSLSKLGYQKIDQLSMPITPPTVGE